MTLPTKARATYWLRYVRTVQNALGIGNYTIHLVAEDPPDGATASIAPNYRRSVAHLRLDPEIDDRTPQEQRQTIVHEVLHLVTADVAELILDGPLVDLIGKPAHHAFVQSWLLAYESSHDWLATILAESGVVPLPPRN